MSTESQMRMDRINRLLTELRYECERGFMESEIDESMDYKFIVPVSRQIKEGVVYCRFETRPVHRNSVMGCNINPEPRIKLVE